MTTSLPERDSSVSSDEQTLSGSDETADGQQTSPDPIAKAVEQRLARERRKHAAELEKARADAVSEWRAKAGVSDEVLSTVQSSAYADLHRALAATQSELASLKAERDQRAQQEKATRLELALDHGLEQLGQRLIGDDDAREFVLAGVAKMLGDDDSAMGDQSRFNATLRQYLNARTWLVAAIAPHGGAGSTPPRLGAPARAADAAPAEVQTSLGAKRLFSAEERSRRLAEMAMRRG